MILNIIEDIKEAIYLNKIELIDIYHMVIRGVIIYLLGVLITRFNKKIIALRTPFNVILFIILGSLFGAAITKSNIFIPVICTFLSLILLNTLTSKLSFDYPKIENLIKGSPAILIKDGEIQQDAMKANYITKRELYNEIISQLHHDDIKKIEIAKLMSDGSIVLFLKKTA